jgi:phage tail P2-like protein
MKLKELDMLEFLPQYMRDDKTAQGIAYAITNVIKDYVIKNVELCNIYGRIEQHDSALLDELAWQFNVPEYIPTLDIIAKRNIIKNCIQTHRRRGTVAAVERVIADVFGNGYVEEWFNYNGEPFHFKIHTTNIKATDDMILEFEKLVKSTQNVRSVLETVILETALDMSSYQGFYMHTAEKVYI